ncbi:MAG: glycosyltransferase family 2 protein [Edaphobacter sp.]|uniref:glycosyltransferase family 2 protein n=1 Tax=Edaphobacter sp. TaxID=1934404 RepID=UPI0023957F06|nr:glycosyltransferase family 2 protein [Edaphobacter sp.]MDE1176976.1 glycosyltransferase family 2 protein [Edaphobacter sp.]
MLITIITPSRNQGQYIKDCLESIFGQTHKEIEHIVLDGMSTDDTADVVARYPSTFLQKKDSGPAQAINRGLNMARGEIVCWLNSDDLFFSPTTLQTVAEIFSQQPSVDVITGDGYYMNHHGKMVQPIVPTHPNRMTHAWIRRYDMFLQPATFWRRNSIQLDENLHYGFDWKLWNDFYLNGLSVLYVPQYFALYRIHTSSLTQLDPPARRKELYQLVCKYSGSKMQRVWCWIVWKAYCLDEHLPGNFVRPPLNIMNRILGKLTSGKITSV